MFPMYVYVGHGSGPVILVKDIRPDARYFVRVRTQYMMGFSEFSNILTIPKFKARAPSDPILKIKKYPQTITLAYDFNGVGTFKVQLWKPCNKRRKRKIAATPKLGAKNQLACPSG